MSHQHAWQAVDQLRSSPKLRSHVLTHVLTFEVLTSKQHVEVDRIDGAMMTMIRSADWHVKDVPM